MSTDGGMSLWRSPEHRAAWRTYFETSLRLETRIDENLRTEAGLSLIDYHVLLLLSEAPGRRMRMGELATRMVFSSSRLTYQIKAMEQRGWVLRRSSSEDKRVNHAVLTATGLDVLRAAGTCHVNTIQSLFTDDLDDDELRMLARVFDRLRERLEHSAARDEGGSGDELSGTG